MKPTILFRKGIAEEGEFEAAQKYFKVVEHRSHCHGDNRDLLVIPRYSALPFYKELEEDLNNQCCSLVNSYAQHQWIASFNWYDDLPYSTPKSWRSLALALADGYHGPFFIKGCTNSRKFEWNTHCYAKDVREAIEVSSRLNQDGLIGGQQLIYRQFVPLRVLEVGLNGLPFSNEWRFFFYQGKLIDYGFYWSCALPENIPNECPLKVKALAYKLAPIVAKHVNFFVLDVAETEAGEGVLIEINDGSMSGLSTINPDSFYNNLFAHVNG